MEVTFDTDANGILNVTAKDKATKREQEITITGSGQLSDDEVERMVHEAEQHTEEDKKFEELAQARNQADQLAYQLENTLNDLSDKVSSSDAESVRAKIETLREAAKGDDAAAIRAAIDEVQQEFSRISQAAYEAAAAEAGQEQAAEGTTGGPAGGPTEGPQQAGPSDDDEVIDAEFEAEDE